MFSVITQYSVEDCRTQQGLSARDYSYGAEQVVFVRIFEKIPTGARPKDFADLHGVLNLPKRCFDLNRESALSICS